MKNWEKAKEKFPSLGKNDFVYETCPSLMGLKDIEKCPKSVYMEIDRCNECWEMEVESE